MASSSLAAIAQEAVTLALRCGSVWPGVVVHLLHNAVLLLWGDRFGDALVPTPGVLVVAGVVAGVGYLGAWQSGPPRTDREASGA